MSIFTESIWPSISSHTWKYRKRDRPVDAILWHCTRGGQGYDGETETNATVNWFKSPNNVVNSSEYEPYAGMSHVVIGPTRIIEAIPIDDYIPAWSSWPSDLHAISVEVAQSNNGQAIEPETIANCVRFAQWAADTYRVPLDRVYPSTDTQWAGMAGHEDTKQGIAQGKSDPGDEFWIPFLAALGGNEMADPRLDAVVAALTGFKGDDPNAMTILNDWNKNGNSLLAGYTSEQAKLAIHMSNHPGSTAVTEHKHQAGGVIQ